MVLEVLLLEVVVVEVVVVEMQGVHSGIGSRKYSYRSFQTSVSNVDSSPSHLIPFLPCSGGIFEIAGCLGLRLGWKTTRRS